MTPITIPITELKPALTGLGKVINPKATLEVLKTLKLERTSDGWVCLTATDIDRFITVRLEQPAKGEPLIMLVPYEDLLKLACSSGKGDHVNLEATSRSTAMLRFNLGDQLGETSVKTPPVEEFPSVPKIQVEVIPVPDSVRHLLHEVLACSSNDASRHILQGACLDTSLPKAHHIVGTDGRHLYSGNSFQLPLKESIIIPKHKILEWKDFNIDGEWRLKVSADKKEPYVQISSRRWRFITRLIEGNYAGAARSSTGQNHDHTGPGQACCSCSVDRTDSLP